MVLQITPDERAALQLLAEGTTTDAVAAHLGTSGDEAEAYLTTLFAKMGAACRAEALAAAFRRGLLSPYPNGKVCGEVGEALTFPSHADV